MNPEVKKAWVGALRSGEYAQGVGRLKWLSRDGRRSYCCLGVLCELAIKDGLDIHYKEEDGGGSYDGEAHYLPSKVQEWAGLTTRNPMADGSYLAEWNDTQNATFEDIATLVEERL